MIVDVVVLQPYIEQALAHEAEDARLVGVPAGDVDALLEFAEDGEEPAAVSVEEIAAHDEHVEHVRPGAVHDGLEGRHISGILLGDDLLGEVEAIGVVSVVVVRAVALDVVAALARHDDGVALQELLPV